MKTRRLLSFSTLFVLGTTSSALHAQTPLGSAFTYQGQLKQAGIQVNDTADFRFLLFDSETGGNQVSSILNSYNVSVVNGLFTAELDFGVSVFNGDARWLQVGVRVPAGGGTYTWLMPRQPLTAVPYATKTRGIHVDAAENVGIGTAEPAQLLHVSGGDARFDGNLEVQGDIRYMPDRQSALQIAACAFQRSDPAADDTFKIYGGHGRITAGTSPYSVELHVPVQLPNGAEVQQLRVYFYDDSLSYDLDLRIDFNRHSTSGAYYDAMASIIASTNDASSAVRSLDDEIILHPVIDNFGCQYALSFTWTVDGPSPSLRFHGCRIVYTVTTLDP